MRYRIVEAGLECFGLTYRSRLCHIEPTISLGRSTFLTVSFQQTFRRPNEASFPLRIQIAPRMCPGGTNADSCTCTRKETRRNSKAIV